MTRAQPSDAAGDGPDTRAGSTGAGGRPTFRPGEVDMKVQVTMEIDKAALSSYSDSYLATAWHVAQVNPAPHGDPDAGELVEHIGREIIRRWLGSVEPELWHHQGKDHYWSELRQLARYEPGGPPGSDQWKHGRWVPKAAADDTGTTNQGGPG